MDNESASKPTPDEVQHARETYTRWTQEILANEKYALFVTGAIWAWWGSQVVLDVNNLSGLLPLIIWFPFLLSGFFALRTKSISHGLISACQFLEDAETREPNWGATLKKINTTQRTPTGFVFWLCLLTVNGLVAITGTWYTMGNPPPKFYWPFWLGIITIVLVGWVLLYVSKRLETLAPDSEAGKAAHGKSEHLDSSLT